MDFYSTEERNKLIQEAMDSYKYKELPLEIDDFFAIHKSVYVYKVVKNRNRLRLLKLLPEYFVRGNSYGEWIIVDDKDLKYELKIMSKYSDDEKEKCFQILDELLEEYNIPNKLSSDGISRIDGMTVEEYFKKNPLFEEDRGK